MDEKNYGNQTSNIGCKFYHHLSDHYHKSDQELMMKTQGADEMIIKLGGNEAYVEEMEEALKIEEYRRKINIPQLPENIQNILNNKGAEATTGTSRERTFRRCD